LEGSIPSPRRDFVAKSTEIETALRRRSRGGSSVFVDSRAEESRRIVWLMELDEATVAGCADRA
jgi:hypothetical protein